MPEIELGETSSEEELDSDQKELIAKNLKRVETHLSISMIALGLTQIIALKLAEAGITEDQLNWKRTYSSRSLSSGSLKRYLQEKLLDSRSTCEKTEPESLINSLFEQLDELSQAALLAA